MRFYTTLVFCVTAAVASSTSADITISSVATLDRAGHLLDGGTFTISGNIADGTTWNAIGGWRQAVYDSVSLTISGTGTSYDGSFTPSAAHNSVGGFTGHSASPVLHYDVLNTAVTAWFYWTNGTDTFRYGLRHSGTNQDATAGSVVQLTDVTDHVTSTVSSGLLWHDSGANPFTGFEEAPPWVNSNFSASAGIPEPSGIALLGLGIAGLVVRRRRRLS